MNSETKRFLKSLVTALALILGLLGLLGTFLWQSGKPLAAWAQGQVRYVAPGGNCGGVSPCYATIQAAVNAASAGDTIKIAQGVYTSEAFQVVYINKAITLTGGYTTSDWSHSDPLNHPTVIDAEDVPRRRGVYIDGTGVEAITLDGLTVERGYAEDSDGGGIYVNDGNVNLRNNNIQNNLTGYDGYGGGVFVNNGTVNLSGNAIQNNSAGDGGGGLHIRDGIVTLNGNAIQDNSSDCCDGGGGVHVYSGTITLSGNSIQNNQAHEGGGVYIVSGAVILSNNTIQNNSAVNGGGVCLDDSWFDRVEVTLTGNSIQGNTASGAGGGIFVYTHDYDGGILTLNGNTVLDNIADGAGGGVYVSDYGDYTITSNGNTILGNTTDGSGGGITLRRGIVDAQNDIIANNTSLWEGVYLSGGTLTARHWTLANNGKYALSSDGGSADLTNIIVASHTLAGLWGTNIVADHALYFNTGAPCGGGASCTNILAGDPKFINPPSRDYHIGSGSAAIDQGVDVGVTTDIDGDSRPQGVAPDLGADEMTTSPPPLSIDKVGPSSADAGDLITYTLTVANNSNSLVNDLVISDVVPIGASYVQALDGGQLVNDQVVRWEVSSLVAGTNINARFVVTASQTIVNNDYRVSASGGISAIGDRAVVTIIGGQRVYLPIILRNQ